MSATPPETLHSESIEALRAPARAAGLPELAGEPALPADAIAQFQRDGFACVRGLASREEVAAYRPLIAEATERHRYDRRPLAERGTYGKAFVQTLNLWRHDPRIAGFTLAQRFARAAARLLGTEAVRVYHDQALFKEPGGGHTPWHQDQTYWPLATPLTVTLWMPLVDIDAVPGTMWFVPGTAALGDLGVPGISSGTQAHFEHLIAERGWQPRSFGALAAGDATFHAGWTLHGARANPTAAMREVMTVIYFADGARVATPTPQQEGDLRAWLPGCAPGAIANSPLNPRIA